VVLVIALVTLAYIATVAMADSHKDRKDKGRQNLDKNTSVPTIRPMPTLKPVHGATPEPKPIPTAAPTPTPEATSTPSNSPVTTPEPMPVPGTQSFGIPDNNSTLVPYYPMPTPEPVAATINNSSGASLSSSEVEIKSVSLHPTPLVSDIEITRPGDSIESLFAGLFGLISVSFIIYLGYLMIRK